MKTRRALIAGAAGLVATGGALVAFTPAGAQSADTENPDDSKSSVVIEGSVPPAVGDAIEISPECQVLFDIETLESDLMELEGEMGEHELSAEDRAEVEEFVAALRAHLDEQGVQYDLVTEEGIEFPEPADDAEWEIADRFIDDYWTDTDLDMEHEDDIDFDGELPQGLIDALNAEDKALRAHLDEVGVAYETEVDENGVSYSMPVDEAGWDQVEAFFDARYGDCEPIFEDSPFGDGFLADEECDIDHDDHNDHDADEDSEDADDDAAEDSEELTPAA